MKLTNLPDYEKEKILTYAPAIIEEIGMRITDIPDGDYNYLFNGDNLPGLMNLAASGYKGMVHCIYIDPPYNTGNKDFIYKDNFIDKDDPWRHSKWLHFMKLRLEMAKELLSDDGVIFISIDDNEQANLKLLCDEIFGENNSAGPLIWKKKDKPSFLSKSVSSMHEYILVYFKKNPIKFIGSINEELTEYRFWNYINPVSTRSFPANYIRTKLKDGIYKAGIYKRNTTTVELLNDITCSDGLITNEFSLIGRWRYSQKWVKEAVEKQETITIKNDGMIPIWSNNDTKKKTIQSILNDRDFVGTTQDGNDLLLDMFGVNNKFSFAKPVSLIKFLVKIATENHKDAIILDFFAGTGTTGHAVLELNNEDGGNRRFILITNDENKICTEVCFPRLQKAMCGYTNKDGVKIEGLGGNLIVELINTDVDCPERRFLLSRKVIEAYAPKAIENLKIKHGVHDEHVCKNYPQNQLRIFATKEKILAVVLDNSVLDGILKQLKAMKTERKIYLYVFTYYGDLDLSEYDWIEIKQNYPTPLLDIFRLASL